MSTYTYSDSCYSDLHKDARGSRPSFGNQAYWDELSPAEKQKQWDALVEELADRQEQEKLEERRAIDRFEYWICNTIESGAADRAEALRLILEQAAAEELPYAFDVEHFEWQQGLPFGYISK